MIVVTIVVPVVFPTAIGYFSIERLWVMLIIDVVVILIWSVFVVVVVSKLVERENREVDQLVGRQVDEVRRQLNRLTDEHRNATADARLRLEDLEGRIRSALEGIGTELGPRSARISAHTMSGVPTMSARLRTRGGNRRARVQRWFRRSGRWMWGKVWGDRSSASG